MSNRFESSVESLVASESEEGLTRVLDGHLMSPHEPQLILSEELKTEEESEADLNGPKRANLQSPLSGLSARLSVVVQTRMGHSSSSLLPVEVLSVSF